MRNFLLALFLSQGIPMLLMNDVYGHTCLGNNNPYVQDNEINWFLWDKLQDNSKIFAFISSLIAFRQKHPQLRNALFLTDEEVDWHGPTPFQPHWDASSRFVAFTLKGEPALYIAFNAHFESVQLILPPGEWRAVVSTEEDWLFHKTGAPLPQTIELRPYSALLLSQG